MYTLKYVVLALYIISAIRCFSFGVYGLKNGNSALFAVALLLIIAVAALLVFYLMTTFT